MRFAPLALLLGLALSVSTASAQTDGVGLRLTPSATYVDFSGDSGLTGGLLYGGGVGLSFGEFVELGGTYLFGRNFETDYTRFSGLEEDPILASMIEDLPVQEVDIQRYGGEVRVNLGSGTLFPFIRAGTGLVRFQPDNRAESTRNIYLLGGAGLQLTGADRYALSVSVEDFAYRYDPATTFFSPADLAAVGLSGDNFNQTTVQNLAFRASLSLYLGGRRPGSLTDIDREFQRQFSGGLSGLSLVVEPFYGRVNFNDAFAYRDQTFVGAEAGFDLGPLVGFRGFYGRGVPKDDPTDFQDIQMYGGDVRLRLSEGSGAVPFLTVGGGYLDVLDEYADDEGAEPQNVNAEDRPFALAGGGIELLLSPRLRGVAEVRGLLMSTQDEEDLSQPENVYVSPFFRAGLSLGLGGDTGGDVNVVRQSRLEEELAAAREEAAQREAELREEIAQARREGDEAAAQRLEVERDRVESMASGRQNATVTRQDGMVRLDNGQVRTAQGDRIVTIPLPEQGELYVRYGEPGGVSIETTGNGQIVQQPNGMISQGMSDAQIREIVRQSIQQSLNGRAMNAQDMDDLERRLQSRLNDRIDDLDDNIDDINDDNRDYDDERIIQALRLLENRILTEIRALRTEMAGRSFAATVDEDGNVVSSVSPTTPVVTGNNSLGYYDPSFSLSPTVGFMLGDANGALIGLQGNYRTSDSFFYIPEILIGIGGDDVFAANADVAFELGDLGLNYVGTPYIRTGIGFVNYSGSEDEPDTFDEEIDDGGTSLTFNLGIGANLRAGNGRFFVDLTSGNFGSFNRLTGGYRLTFGD